MELVTFFQSWFFNLNIQSQGQIAELMMDVADIKNTKWA